MLLQELFKKEVDFVINEVSPTYWEASKILSTGKEMVFAAYGGDDNNVTHKLWTFGFTVDDSYDKNGDGNGIEVFNTMVAMVEQFIKDMNPIQVAFSAEEENRVKLYRRLFGRIFKGWKSVVVYDEAADTHVMAYIDAPLFPVKDGAVVVSRDCLVTTNSDLFTGIGEQLDDEFKELEKGNK